MLLLEKGGRGKQTAAGSRVHGGLTLLHRQKSAALGINHFYIIKISGKSYFQGDSMKTDYRLTLIQITLKDQC